MRTEAARNNAEWCDIVCRLHGIPGRFAADAWTAPRRTPPLYPDAVTLAPGVPAERVLARIDTAAPAWRGSLAAVARHFPGLPAVGYEHGPALAAALRQGFRPIGAVRAWLAGG